MTEKSNILRKSTSFWDLFGMAVSVLCVVHCVLTPLVLFLAPAILASGVVTEDITHKILIVFVALAGLFALTPGFRIHGDRRPLVFGVLGLFLMAFATFAVHDFLGHEWESILAIPASAAIIYSHYLNRKQCRLCAHHNH